MSAVPLAGMKPGRFASFSSDGSSAEGSTLVGKATNGVKKAAASALHVPQLAPIAWVSIAVFGLACVGAGIGFSYLVVTQVKPWPTPDVHKVDLDTAITAVRALAAEAKAAGLSAGNTAANNSALIDSMLMSLSLVDTLVDTIRVQHSEHTMALNALNATFNTSIAERDARLDALETSNAQLTSAITDLQANKTSIWIALNSLSGSRVSQQASIVANAAAIAAATSSVNTLTTSVAAATSSVNTLTTSVSALSTIVTSNTFDIRLLINNQTSLTTSILWLQTNITDIRSNQTVLWTTVNGISTGGGGGGCTCPGVTLVGGVWTVTADTIVMQPTGFDSNGAMKLTTSEIDVYLPISSQSGAIVSDMAQQIVTIKSKTGSALGPGNSCGINCSPPFFYPP
jgi:uncharacterized integral membrane protein